MFTWRTGLIVAHWCPSFKKERREVNSTFLFPLPPKSQEKNYKYKRPIHMQQRICPVQDKEDVRIKKTKQKHTPLPRVKPGARVRVPSSTTKLRKQATHQGQLKRPWKWPWNEPKFDSRSRTNSFSFDFHRPQMKGKHTRTIVCVGAYNYSQLSQSSPWKPHLGLSLGGWPAGHEIFCVNVNCSSR